MTKMMKLLLAATAMTVSGAAEATTLRFTATSAAFGQLGYMDFDSSIFNGTSQQYVTNNNILNIYFYNPSNGFIVNTRGPSNNGTYFDSSGAVPTVVGGGGYTGGTSPNGVLLAGNFYVGFGGSNYQDVRWSTAAVAAAVPETATWAMMIAGFGMMGAAMRTRRRSTKVSFA